MRISDWSSDVCSSDLFEAQRAADRIGLHQPQVEPLTDAVADPSMLAVERARRLVIEKAFAAQRRHRHQPIAAEPVDGREKAEGLHPGDPRRDRKSTSLNSSH